MIQKIKMLLLSLSAVFIIGAPALLPATVGATDQIQNGVCTGANTLQVTETPTSQCPSGPDQTNKVNQIITDVINVFSVVVGIVAVIMIVYAGFKYITSGGAQEKVTSAKNTILYAIIGLVIVALAQIIVKFVLNKATAS